MLVLTLFLAFSFLLQKQLVHCSLFQPIGDGISGDDDSASKKRTFPNDSTEGSAPKKPATTQVPMSVVDTTTTTLRLPESPSPRLTSPTGFLSMGSSSGGLLTPGRMDMNDGIPQDVMNVPKAKRIPSSGSYTALARAAMTNRIRDENEHYQGVY